MSETTPSLGFPEAARRLGVPLRVLRDAIRAGRIPAPPHQGATSAIPAEWLDRAQAAVQAQPKVLNRASLLKVRPFSHYEGTSAWHKYQRRVREYARFRAAAKPAP